jgi:hypothetical protein
MNTSKVVPQNSNKIVVDSVILSNETDSQNIIINSGREVALTGSKQVVIASDNLPVQYDPTDFVEIPTGPSMPPVADPTSFDHFKRYVNSKFCYNSSILDTAIVLERTPCMAFQVDIWTLMEHRSVEQRSKPYRGESVPGKTVGNIFDWKGSLFEPPSTILQNKRVKLQPLTETQQKVKCPSCNTKGKQLCSSCGGLGIVVKNQKINHCSLCHGTGEISCSRCASTAYLLTYDEMKLTWHTLHSVSYYQNSFLPEKLIRQMPNKPIFFDDNRDWTNDIFLTSYGDLFQFLGEHSPFHFEKGIQQQYQDEHFIKLKESTAIRRLKCLIRCINIQETDYKLEGYLNKTERKKSKH